jgi:hypothetical protein
MSNRTEATTRKRSQKPPGDYSHCACSRLYVRREKALDFSGCNSRPGTDSLHPVAIETAVEATKLSELSMERVAGRLRERTGHNESER